MWPAGPRHCRSSTSASPSPLARRSERWGGWGGGRFGRTAKCPPPPTPPHHSLREWEEGSAPCPLRTSRTALPFRRRRSSSPRSASRELPRAACRLARRARRDRTLGAAQARHRRIAHRRLGAARQDRRRRARRQGPAGDRADLARPQAALRRTVRLARRPRRQAVEPRSDAVPAGDARRTRSRISPGSSPRDFVAEWKWDGIRVQAVAGTRDDGAIVARLYSRTGEDISGSFPDLVEALRLPAAIDGELLIVRDGRVQSFNVLQQRLNRKTVNAKLLAEFPAHLRAYDLLVDGDEDLREQPFAARRARLEALIARLDDPRIDISPLVPVCHLGRAGRRTPGPGRGRRRRRCRRGRRRHAQAPRRALRSGPAERTVVEVEARSVHRRCRADLCPARSRQALVVLFRLHLRRLDERRRRRRARAGRQGLFRLHRRGADRRSTATCAATPSSASARCARSCTRPTRAWCWRSRSKGCSARRGTSPASPCAFRASAGCAGTSRRARPTALDTLERMLEKIEAGPRRQ